MQIRCQIFYLWKEKRHSENFRRQVSLILEKGNVSSVKHHHTSSFSSQTKLPQINSTAPYSEVPLDLPVEFQSDLTPATAPSTVHGQFVLALVECGTFHWRIHLPDYDLIVFNPVDMVSGNLLLNAFVQMERYMNHLHTWTYNCECSMFHLCSEEEKTCMHVRFFIENVNVYTTSLFSSDKPPHLPDTPICQKIEKSIKLMWKPVIRPDCHKQAHRFSVVPSIEGVKPSVVSLTKSSFLCPQGLCKVMKGRIRKVKFLGTSELCPHLQTVWQHKSEWQFLVPQADLHAAVSNETPSAKKSDNDNDENSTGTQTTVLVDEDATSDSEDEEITRTKKLVSVFLRIS